MFARVVYNLCSPCGSRRGEVASIEVTDRSRSRWYIHPWREEDGSAELRFRGQKVEGRWVVTEIQMTAPDGLNGTMVRQIPWTRLEAHLAARERARQHPKSVLRIETVHPAEIRLRSPRKRPYGDDFYRAVADAYVAAIDRPAVRIAAASKVPVTSVHNWVREARRRGFLPPGRKGKTG